jgi:hypothetical protein
MKGFPFFRNLVMALLIIIFISACSKGDSSLVSPGGVTADYGASNIYRNPIYVIANDWVKVSEREYRCTFSGLMSFANVHPQFTRVYVLENNKETNISIGATDFMGGKLSIRQVYPDVWVAFKVASDIQTLPFTSLDLKIVFE